MKQEDVTKGETAVEAAANEVKAVAELSCSAVARAISRPASSELVVGVPAALAVLLLVVVPPLCRGGGGTVCEWLMAVLTCMGRKKTHETQKTHKLTQAKKYSDALVESKTHEQSTQ